MTVRCFRSDSSPRSRPYLFERDAIRAAGGELTVADGASSAESVEQAGDAEIRCSHGNRF